ncbi:MAG: hypothetical protein HYT70_04545 [Candidatus Aenigmarchaeota archaeon]|nr:hypothetical protein [Candidatus Aenigmarchaeota archaeon]
MNKFNSWEDVERRLKNLYFYSDLTSGEFYAIHMKRCKNYFLVNKLRKKGFTYISIEKRLKLPRNCVNRYLNKSKPYLYVLASSIPNCRLNIRHKLLPLHSKKGGHAYFDFIKVPMEIKFYDEIIFILKQLGNRNKNVGLKEKALAYILGMMVSDTSKPLGYRFSNQCLISLTRRYDWDLDIGDNVCKYFITLGITAHRIKDHVDYRERAPYGEYRWITEKSPFIRYLLQSLLGLDINERTTYDKVKMKWIFSCPKSFIIPFLQGLYDGDGSTHNFWRIELSCEPNQQFIIKLLRKLNIDAYLDGDAVSIHNRKSILTAEKISIFKYAKGRKNKLKKLVSMIENYKSIEEIDMKVKEMIMYLKKRGVSGGNVSEYVFDNFKIGVTPNSINHLFRKFNN